MRRVSAPSMARAAAAALWMAAVASARACPPFSEPDGDGGCVVCDCAGACFDAARLAAWPADGRCDRGAPDYACAAFEYDGGDCGAQQQPAQGAAAAAAEPAVVLRDNIFARDIVGLHVT